MPVKFGVIGCGSIAQKRHLPEIAANPDAEVVAVYDPNPVRASEVAQKFGGKAFDQVEALLADGSVDAVAVCSPNAAHAPQTVAALSAGKHVMVEKPMATTRDEARSMLDAAKRSGKFLMVGQNQRLMPPHVKAKEILDSGRLGEVLAFRTSFKHPGPDGWSIDRDKSWFFRKPEAAMGVCGDLGIHKADLMRYLLGQEFAEVTGFVSTRDKRTPDGKLLDLDDNAFFTLKTDRGVIGTMEISWTNYGGEDNQTVLYCQRGVIQLGVDPQYGVVVQYKDGARELHQLGAVATNTRQTDSGVTRMFVRSILDRKQPSIDGSEGYKSLNVILTAMEAAQQGRTLRIES